MKKLFLFVGLLCLTVFCSCSESAISGTEQGGSSLPETDVASVSSSDSQSFSDLPTSNDVSREPAEYYITEIEPEKDSSGFCGSAPFLEFDSFEEFRLALVTQEFTESQKNTLRLFDADENGIRSIHPNRVLNPDGVMLDITTWEGFLEQTGPIEWYGEYYRVPLSGRSLYVGKKYHDAMYESQLKRMNNEIVSLVEESVVEDEGILKTVLKYISPGGNEYRYVLYNIEEEKRSCRVIESYHGFDGDHVEFSWVFVEQDNGICVCFSGFGHQVRILDVPLYFEALSSVSGSGVAAE